MSKSEFKTKISFDKWSGENNYDEDFLFISENNTIDFKDKTCNMSFYLVCDGHSSARPRTGHIAPKFVIDNFLKEFKKNAKKNGTVTKTIKNTLKIIDDSLYKYLSKYQIQNTGTTVNGILINNTENTLYTINLGDSRTCIYSNEFSNIFCTKDHDVSNKDEQIYFIKKGCFTDGRYLYSKKDDEGLAMTRSIGDMGIGITECLRNDADVVSFDINTLIKKNKKVKIIIASDGYWDVLKQFYKYEITDILRKTRFVAKSHINKIKNLVNDKSLSIPWDNTSVILITLNK